MIEKHLSIQDTIAIVFFLGALIKAIQFFYFDKKNKGLTKQTRRKK